MYIVTAKTNGISMTIHDNGKRKLTSGNVVQGVNAIDSFSFTISPANPAFNELSEYTTLISVYNSSKKFYEFLGRVLYTNPSMDENGLAKRDVVCESYFGFLCDSQQPYVEEKSWTVRGLLEYLIEVHNSQLEEYKHFVVGEVTVEDPNDTLYLGIQRANTWKVIGEKLIGKLGGEIRLRVADGVNYIDYVPQIGETKATEIALSRNMKSISQEKDPSEYITRLIPLGVKIKEERTTFDDAGNQSTEMVETGERLDISSVNDGKNYIDDTEAIERYGIRVGYVEFDEVTVAENLLSKGYKYLAENNKVKIKYQITALELALLGLDIDDFRAGNSHPVKNPLLGINDIARIIKKTVNICDFHKSTIEIGENFKTLSEIQISGATELENLKNGISKIEGEYVTNDKIASESLATTSLIQQAVESILMSVEETYFKIEGHEEYAATQATTLEQLVDEFIMKFTTTESQIVEVDGELQTKFSELYEYIRFEGGSIKLGASDSAISLSIEHDIINFSRNGVVFGSWDGDNFYTGNIVIRLNERFQLGNFAALPRSDGSVMWLKVGE